MPAGAGFIKLKQEWFAFSLEWATTTSKETVLFTFAAFLSCVHHVVEENGVITVI